VAAPQKLSGQDRARPFRLLLWVQAADMAGGAALYLFADRIPLPGEVYGLPVMEFAGIALFMIGLIGFGLFYALARRAEGGRL
jgi:hypothetical protein